jgi:hypothetical protein
MNKIPYFELITKKPLLKSLIFNLKSNLEEIFNL